MLTPAPAPSSDLNDLVAQARRAHPGIGLPASRLHARLRALRATAGEGIELRADDVYVALACLAGDPAALAALERKLVNAARPPLNRLGFSHDERVELLQMARCKLIVPQGERPPRLDSYAGRGPLDAWLQALVTRLALSAKRSRADAPVEDDDETWLAWPSPQDDAEIALLKRSCGEAFRRAAREAFGALEPKVRLVLRQHLLDGLAAEQLAALHRVHVVTIYRWLRDARASYLAETRRRLSAALKLDEGGVDSLLRVLESQLELSLRRLVTASP